MFLQTLWASFGQFFQTGIGFVSVLVMAALLGPEAYGLFALALVIVGTSEILTGGHIADVLVQKENPEAGHEGFIFLLQLGGASLIALAVFLLRNNLAVWLAAPQLAEIIGGAVWISILGSLCGVPTSLLVRRLRYDLLAYGNVVASVTALLIGIGMALTGEGVWSLVWMEIARRLINLVLFALFAGWVPSLSFQRRHAADVLGFAVKRIENRGLFFFGYAFVPRVIIGRSLGEEALGIYTIALRLIEQLKGIFCDSVGAIIFPVSARLVGEPQRIKTILKATTRLTGWIFWPALLGATAVLPLFAQLGLGERWQALPLTLILLSVGFLSGPIDVYTSSLLMAFNRLRAISIVRIVYICVLLPSLLIGIHLGGLLGAAIGLSICQWLCWPVSALYVKAVSDYGPAEQLSTLLCAVLPAILMYACVLWFIQQNYFGFLLTELGRLIVAILFGVIVYLAAWLAFNRRVAPELWKAVRALLARDTETMRQSVRNIAIPQH